VIGDRDPQSGPAKDHRQRYKVAVDIETPQSAHLWAGYCIKEYGSVLIDLTLSEGETAARTVPLYSWRRGRRLSMKTSLLGSMPGSDPALY